MSSSSSAVTAEPGNIEVSSWLKTLPIAPEFYPTLAEFQDPIAYIFKIEKEASKYGICKIVPPVPPLAKKTIITNLNASLAARSTTSNPKSSPTFTTRQQQIGFCPRKHRPVQKPVWQSGENYTVPQFTAKAKSFEKNYLKKIPKKTLSSLEVETLYWKANGDKPFSVEYANDMPGSAFGPVSVKKYGKEAGDSLTVGDTAWNMRGVSRAKGSLLRFMKEEIPGVTSPMVYIAMMFSWFAWHVEDHDLHSLNYMHMGAGKTWYGVPRDAAVALEEVIRMQGYGGEINPLVTFHILGEKNTVMSPEVLISEGVPCCRLVQNAGEFVVTFPRAYHSGFSHGFNCGEAANIATPEWLRYAKEAAIRRASINSSPMVSHCQLLYDLALSLCSRISRESNSEPRSSRLKDRKKGEGETQIKELFAEDVIRNNELLHILGQGSSIVLLPQNSLDDVVDSTLEIASQFKENPGLSFGLFSSIEETKSAGSLVSDNFMLNTKMDANKLSGLCTFTSSTEKPENERERNAQGNKLSDKGLFSCVTCGVLNFACVAIVQPRDAATRHFTSADCTIFSNRDTFSGSIGSDGILCATPSNSHALKSCSGRVDKNVHGGLFEVPIQSIEKLESADQNEGVISNIKMETASTALGLLASTYGNTSDSDDEERVEVDVILCDDKAKVRDLPPKSERNKSRHNDDLNCYFEVDVNSSSIQKESNIVGTTVMPHTTNSTLTFENASGPVTLGSNNEDSSRLHVFCLQHAAEVEKQLRPLGGTHILLLCHPDYPELEAAAKEVTEEMGIDYIWNEMTFREATEEDEEKIQLALESEESLHGNGDWSVRLGINLYYSAILSRSPLYSKQMPYNTIIYKAFGRSSPSSSSTPTKLKFYGKGSSVRQKRIKMVGKWCGKVWMSNQVHPLLVEKDSEVGEEHEQDQPEEEHEQDQPEEEEEMEEEEEEEEMEEQEEQEDDEEEEQDEEQEERSFYAWGRPEVKLEKKKSVSNGITTSSCTRRSARKRKNEVESSIPLRKAPKLSVVKSEPKKRAMVKKIKGTVVEEGEYGCDMEGCTMSFVSKQELVLHKRNICPVKGCGKKFFSHKYLVQHRRVHDDDRPLRCPWKGCKRTFKWAWARTEHIRVHTGERPYVCTVSGCGQTFRFVSDFSRHKRKTGHSTKNG